MKNQYLCSLAVVTMFATPVVNAMDPAIFFGTQVIASIATNIRASLTPTPKPSIYISGNQIIYIGKSKTRDNLERIYGKEFPLDTVFVNIGFQNVEPQELPQVIPYSLIYENNQRQEIEEGHSLTLSINGKAMQVTCKQRNAPYAPKQKFEHVTSHLATNFLSRPHWLIEDESEQSLIEAGIITAEMAVMNK